MTLKNIKVNCYNLDSLTVSWEFDHPEEIAHYTISVYRGNTIEDVSTLLGTFDATEYPFYTDADIDLRNNWRIYYYKVELTNDIDKSVTTYDPVCLTYEPDYIALRLIDKYNLVLDNLRFGGREIQVFIKKTEGIRCPHCWDEIKQRISKSNCESCYNTGFDGGFYNSIGSRFIISPEFVNWTQTVWGKLGENEKIAWCANFPLLSVGDVIRENRLGRNWRVINRVQRMERSGAYVKQVFAIHEVNRQDAEYKLGNQ